MIEHELKCNRRVCEWYVCNKFIGLKKDNLGEEPKIIKNYYFQIVQAVKLTKTVSPSWFGE